MARPTQLALRVSAAACIPDTAVFAPDTLQEVFATYLGSSGHDLPRGIALDPQGNIYIAGQTTSPNFPTKNAFQSTPPAPNGVQQGQGNSFIVKISAIGPIQSGRDFSLGFDSPTVTAQAGTKARIKININRTGGFTGNITVAPGLPGSGIKPKPNASITTTDSRVTFKYKTGAASPGQYPITFTGTDSSGKLRTATVTLIVQ
ncbi:MAG TPA: SBBP repeat-containing protein [Blastocatellia bacterium]|nr:SBBP repeat-containing protein [Blastocatellia bacterium]